MSEPLSNSVLKRGWIVAKPFVKSYIYFRINTLDKAVDDWPRDLTVTDTM